MRIRLHPAAIAEAGDARRWYAEREPDVAAAFMAEVDAAIERIRELPHTWPRFEKGTRRFLFKRFPYYLIYRVTEDAIEVVAVTHAHQRPGYWYDR